MAASSKVLVAFLVLPVALVFTYLYAQRETDKPRFYVDNDLESDVWMIPIIEPYRITTADGGSRPQAGYSRWNFQEQGLENQFHPDSLNYQQGFITFHDASQNKYGYYALRENKTTFLHSYQQFNSFVQAEAIEKVLYNAETVYRCWQQTRQLPWAKEIFVQSYSSTTSN